MCWAETVFCAFTTAPGHILMKCSYRLRLSTNLKGMASSQLPDSTNQSASFSSPWCKGNQVSGHDKTYPGSHYLHDMSRYGILTRCTVNCQVQRRAFTIHSEQKSLWYADHWLSHVAFVSAVADGLSWAKYLTFSELSAWCKQVESMSLNK